MYGKQSTRVTFLVYIQCIFSVKHAHISKRAKQKQSEYIPVPSSVSDPGLPPKLKHIQIRNV